MKFGDSLDMRIANFAQQYETYLNNKQKGGLKDKMDHNKSTEELQAMMKRAREKNASNRKIRQNQKKS